MQLPRLDNVRRGRGPPIPPFPPSAVSPTTRKPAGRIRRSRRLILVGAVTSVTLLVFIGGAVWLQGRVRGTEFSPTHFQTRDFSFYEIPLLHLQVSPIRRVVRAGATSSHLRQRGLISVPKGPPTGWHLARLARGVNAPTPADADILVQYLELRADSDVFWRTWSIDHPRQAAVLWPVIQRLAERELYVLMPDVFRLTQREDQGPTALAAAIDDYLQDAYLRLALDVRDAGRIELARALLTEAAGDFPDDPAIRRALSSLPAMPPAEKAPVEAP